MKKKISKKLPKHYVLIDSNVIWQEDKSEVVSEDFTKFWGEYANKYDLELLVPEVVRSEILFQHTSVGLKLLDKVNDKFDTLSKITDSKYKHTNTSKKLRGHTEKRIDKWIKSVKALILETPVDTIDWNNLIEKAIWRKKPFTEDRKTEKGFRDSLIYETLSNFIESEKNIDIAFITSDGPLREAVEERLGKENNVNIFQALDDFESYLKLTDEKLTNEFAKEIRKKATLKFFDGRHGKGIFYKDSIPERIKNDFSSDLELPPGSPIFSLGAQTNFLNPFSDSAVTTGWQSLAPDRFWIGQSLFKDKVGESEFHWINKVFFVQPFKYYSGGSQAILYPAQDSQINLLKIEFSIHWSSFVKSDTRFYKIKVENIEKSDSKFAIPTAEEVKNYNLDSYFKTQTYK